MKDKQRFLKAYEPLAKKLITLLARKKELNREACYSGDVAGSIDNCDKQKKKLEKELATVSVKLVTMNRAVERIKNRSYRNALISHFWRKDIEVAEKTLIKALEMFEPTREELKLVC